MAFDSSMYRICAVVNFVADLVACEEGCEGGLQGLPDMKASEKEGHRRQRHRRENTTKSYFKL